MKCFSIKWVFLLALVSINVCTLAQSDSSLVRLMTSSTGRTTGHIADVIIQSTTDVQLNVVPQIFYIPSLDNFQPYIACIREELTIPSKDSARIRIEGFCADVNKPSIPAGQSLPPIDTWIPVDEPNWLGIQLSRTLEQSIGSSIHIVNREPVKPFMASLIPDTLNAPVFSPDTNSQTGSVVTWPGTETPVGGFFTSEVNPEIIAQVLVEALNRIAIAFDEMYQESNKLTPFAPDPDKEREAVIQQSFWLYTTALEGGSYEKDDFSERVYDQYEIKTGRSPKRLKQEQRNELDAGITVFWNVFGTTTTAAQVLQSFVEVENDSIRISALWDDLQLSGVRMKPGYPFTSGSGRFPTIPVIAGVAAIGTSGYLLLKKEDLSELCSFTLTTETMNSTCGLPNGSATVTVEPPGEYNYYWPAFGGSFPNIHVPAGTYSVFVTPQNVECSQATSVTIENINVEFTADISIVPANCGSNDGSVTITMNPPGDYDYSWSNVHAGSSQSNLVADKYSVTVSLGGVCSEVYQVVVDELGVPFSAQTSTTSAQCGGSDGSAIVLTSPPGDYSYIWSNGSTSASIGNVPAGEYTVTVAQTGTACDTVITAVVDEPPANFIVDVTTSAANCAGVGGDIILQLQNQGSGPLFLIANGEAMNVPTGIVHLNTYLTIFPGLWRLTIRDLNLNPTCIQDTLVLVPEIIEVLSPQDDYYETTIDEPVYGNVLDNDSGFQLYAYLSGQPSGGMVVINQDGSFIYTPPSGIPGQFTFDCFIQDGCGNWKVSIVTILVKDCLIEATFTVTSANCGLMNGTISTQINPPANYTFEWTNLSSTQDLTDIPAGQYTVTITNIDLDCQRIYHVEVQDTSMLEISVHEIYPPTEPTSEDGRFTFFITQEETSPYTIFLNGDEWGMTTETTVEIDGLVAGDYTIYLLDANGCLSNILEVRVPLPGLLGLEVGFGLMTAPVPEPVYPEHSRREGPHHHSSTTNKTSIRSLMDVGLHYRVSGIMQLSSIVIYSDVYDYRDTPDNVPMFRFSHLMEIGRWRYRGFDFKVYGGMSVDWMNDVPTKQYWTMRGSATKRIGKMLTAHATVSLRGWRSIEMPMIEIRVSMPVMREQTSKLTR